VVNICLRKTGENNDLPVKSFAAQKRFFKISSLMLINAVGEYED
jgi:hypothetical protein